MLKEDDEGHMKKALQNNDIQIIEFKETRVAVLEHRGDPMRLNYSIQQFIAWRKDNGLSPKHSATFNFLYTDPNSILPEDFRIGLCAATDREVLPNSAGIVSQIIPGGRCAILRHIGSEDHFGESVHYLYAVWLPQSGEILRDFPLYCQRVAFFPEVPEYEAITDIFLPLK